MSNFPDFSIHGYRVKRKLGSNAAGGRVTYLAIDLDTFEKVVIKQFQFAKSGSSWAGYDSYKREIQILKSLKHPGICQYLSSFQTSDGFCMIQEYKPALSLAASCGFSIDEIQKIATTVLEILIYLQKQTPSIIHRDVKPENILIDELSNIYLIDFGFARAGNGEVAISSVVKGTLGFMPPEQLFNRQLTESSDLYGLGMTLICILTGTSSAEIGNLIDSTYRINFSHLLPQVNTRWLKWLQKMVEPNVKDRYPNAISALTEMPEEPIYLPEARLNRSSLELKSTYKRQILTQTITVENSICETLLQGIWEVAPHPNDPRSLNHEHTWIVIQPAVFKDNYVQCQVTIDTGRLMTGKTYQRELLLHNNSSTSPQSLILQVQTPSTQIRVKKMPYRFLALLFLISCVITCTLIQALLVAGFEPTGTVSFGMITGTSLGLEGTAWFMAMIGAMTGATAGVVAGVAVGLIALYMVVTESLSGSVNVSGVIITAGLMSGVIAGVLIGMVTETLYEQGFRKENSIALAVLTIAAAGVMGIGLTVGFSHPGTIAITIVTNLLLLIALARPLMERMKLIRAYQDSERHLIQP
jgi:serine/threonine protein kinase